VLLKAVLKSVIELAIFFINKFLKVFSHVLSFFFN
jgi:hypothetical protein